MRRKQLQQYFTWSMMETTQKKNKQQLTGNKYVTYVGFMQLETCANGQRSTLTSNGRRLCSETVRGAAYRVSTYCEPEPYYTTNNWHFVSTYFVLAHNIRRKKKRMKNK